MSEEDNPNPNPNPSRLNLRQSVADLTADLSRRSITLPALRRSFDELTDEARRSVMDGLRERTRTMPDLEELRERARSSVEGWTPMIRERGQSLYDLRPAIRDIGQDTGRSIRDLGPTIRDGAVEARQSLTNLGPSLTNLGPSLRDGARTLGRNIENAAPIIREGARSVTFMTARSLQDFGPNLVDQYRRYPLRRRVVNGVRGLAGMIGNGVRDFVDEFRSAVRDFGDHLERTYHPSEKLKGLVKSFNVRIIAIPEPLMREI